MVVVAALALFAGFVLLYVGVRGVYWDAPWNLVMSWFQGTSTASMGKTPS